MFDDIPKFADGLVVNDCPRLTPEKRAEQSAACAGASPITEYVWRSDDQPPTLKWDGAFEDLIDRRIDLIDRLTKRGVCLLPWRILDALPGDRKRSSILNWFQGSVPSCAAHGGTHAMQDAMLLDIALGAPRIYDALNPIYPFYVAKGESLAGGLNLFDLARQLNNGGSFAVSDVGADNKSAPRDYRLFLEKARSRQAAIIYIEDNFVDKIFRACHAGFSVCFASNTIWNSAKIDQNGVKTMDRKTFGGHAQSKVGYRVTGGVEYVYNRNSHGKIYGSSDEGEPQEGAWNTRRHVEEEARTMPDYGFPFVVLCENPLASEPVMMNAFAATFPAAWKA